MDVILPSHQYIKYILLGSLTFLDCEHRDLILIKTPCFPSLTLFCLSKRISNFVKNFVVQLVFF
jgi:hypothetical protein